MTFTHAVGNAVKMASPIGDRCLCARPVQGTFSRIRRPMSFRHHPRTLTQMRPQIPDTFPPCALTHPHRSRRLEESILRRVPQMRRFD